MAATFMSSSLAFKRTHLFFTFLYLFLIFFLGSQFHDTSQSKSIISRRKNSNHKWTSSRKDYGLVIAFSLLARGLSSALDKKLLRDHGITNIVTVDIKPLPPNGDIHYLFVPAHDVSGQDLFGCFESVFEFIEKGVKSGSVLVHCYHGVSRSATLVISYLQKKYKISPEEGLARLQAVRPSVLPNEGFLAQLRLYGVLMELNKMDSIVSRWYHLKQMADLHGGTPVGFPQGELSCESTFKCRTCRYVLAYGKDVLYHRPGENPDWRDLSWVRFALNDQQIRIGSCRQAFFIIPPPWITANSAPQGKLLCPKCCSKIGAFSWDQNLKCPCAASYQPGFYFTPSKIDFIANK